MNTLLAFVVTSDYVECSLLVFAENRGEAKSIAHRSEWFVDEEWTDLRVRREPRADAFGETHGKGRIECSTADEQRLLRSLGWHQLEHSYEDCSKCGLNEWELVPESKLTEVGDTYVCAGCREANPTEI
jgi:hypothetical protein